MRDFGAVHEERRPEPSSLHLKIKSLRRDACEMPLRISDSVNSVSSNDRSRPIIVYQEY
jgi:hypothetical protein